MPDTNKSSLGTDSGLKKDPNPGEKPLSSREEQEIQEEYTIADPPGASINETDNAVPEEPAGEPVAVPTSVQQHPFKRLLATYGRNKKWTIPVTIVVLLVLLLGIPVTRYPIAGTFLKQDYKLAVLDSTTRMPVSNAVVTLAGVTTKTDNEGKVTLKVKVGHAKLNIAKKYYKGYSADTLIPLHASNQVHQILVEATGRQVPLSVVNVITGKPVENALLKIADTEGRTDKQGKLTIVLPADKTKLTVIITNDGYNTANGEIQVTEQVDKQNTFQLTPAGRVYFLSKQSGKIDLVKTNLDGSDRRTVLAGTGQEDAQDTLLLASRDWKFLMLKSRRDSKLPKVYLIDTATDKVSSVDEGEASFSFIGWSSHRFGYSVTRTAYTDWQPKKQVLKSYNADTGQIAMLDESQAQGSDATNYRTQAFSNFYAVDDRIVYTTYWYGTDFTKSFGIKSNAVRSVQLSGQGKQEYKAFPEDHYSSLDLTLYAPKGLYIAVYSNDENKRVFFELEGQSFKPASIDQAKFNEQYSSPSTYLASPSGDQTFWSESRDGKDTFFIGDADAQNSKQIAILDGYQVYGWYGNDYLLASKKGSELYILSVQGGSLHKVSDYNKPTTVFRGYGGGYGGL